MSTMRVYLDNNATSEPLPEVTAAVSESLTDHWGNPSSDHGRGERARANLREARECVAQLAGVAAENIVFTSGGTESNQLAFRLALARAGTGNTLRLAVSAVEHSSVMRLAERHAEGEDQVSFVGVDSNGVVDLEAVERDLREGIDLLSVQWANSETGVLQPIAEIAAMCLEQGALFHVDAAQAIGRLPISGDEVLPDFMSWSGHKLHAPKGIGALAVGSAVGVGRVEGAQEQGLRTGTENTPGISGFGAASKVRANQLEEIIGHMAQLRDRFEQGILDACPDVRVNGEGASRVCNTTNLFFPGIRGQGLVARLELAGIDCSQTSACLRARPEPSYVLCAMGLSEDEAYGSIRFSVSVLNTVEEIDAAAEAVVRGFQDLAKRNLRLIGTS